MKKLFTTLVFVLLLSALFLGTFGVVANAETSSDALYYTIEDGEVTITGINGWVDCTNIVIPETIECYPVTAIGNFAFENNDSIKTVTMSDSVISIGRSAFEDCDNLTTVKLSKNLERIDWDCFSGCKSLSEIEIPDGVTYIGIFAFSSTWSLKSITIPANAVIDSIAEYSGTFSYSDITSVTFESGRTIIPPKMFIQCGELTTVYLPKSVNKIGKDAFAECSSLTDIWYQGTEADKTKIELAGGNTALVNATWHYNSCAPDEHNYVAKVTAPTCAKKGYTTYTCKCGDSYVSNYKNATEKHNYTAAICTAPKTCKVCKATTGKANGHKYTNACDTSCNTCKATRKITHSYKNIVTKATLTKGGNIKTICSVCGNVSKITTVYYPKTIALSATKFTYNGSAKAPSVTVKNSQGKALVKGTDYTVKYSDGRKNVGKYTVTVTFKGNYSGTKTLTFNILPSKTSKITATQTTTTLKASWKKVTGATGYKVELLNANGKVVKSATTTKLTYTFSKLSAGTTYKIKVTAYKTISGKKQYSLVSTTLTTATKPATPTLTLSSTTKGKANLKWTNVAGESGYQVYYSTSKNGTYSKAGVYNTNTVNGTKSNLTSKKTYYFKVRAYKKVGSTTIYGAWSSVKSVKIK